ncbi:group II intron maturase-specific domain-containing protein [Rhodococcus koreensis]
MASSATVGSGLDPVRDLQHALYRAAKADPRRRFHSLRDKVFRRDVLWRAWVAVRANNGAPGVDKTTLAEVEQYGIERLLDELAAQLRDGTYRPLPLRRVWIPKPGSKEQRPLSIPAVRDRIVQAACKIVLEPIFEADARWPSDKAMQHARDRIRGLTGSNRTLLSVDVIVGELNSFLRGWAGYFRYGNSSARFTKIRHYALTRVVGMLAKKHRRSRRFGMWVVSQSSDNQLGLISLDGIVVAPRPCRAWRVTPNAGGERRR